MAEETPIRGAASRTEERQDLAGIVSRYRRHVPLIAIITAIFIVLMGVATLFMPTRYTATAEITFAPQQAAVRAQGTQDVVLSDQARDAAIDAEVQQAMSIPVAKLVVADQRLERIPSIRKAAAKYNADAQNATEALAAAALENLRARRVAQTALINVSYTTGDPLLATNIANSFATQLLKIDVKRKLSETNDTADRLDQRVESLRKQAEAADAAVAQYKVSHNLLSDPSSTATETEIANINGSLAEALAQQAEARARAAATASASTNGSAGNSNDALTSATMSELRRQQADTGRRVAELSANYGPRYPALVQAEKERDEIDAQVNREIARNVQNATSAQTVANQRVASLTASLNAARSRVAGNVGSSVAASDLQRRADTARDLYNNLLASSGQQTANRYLVEPDVRLTSPASPPLQPSSPVLVLNLFLGLVIGLIIGLLVAYVRERWSIGLNSIDDIDRLLEQNYLNSIPTLASSIDGAKTQDPVEAVVAHPLSLYSEAFRSLATSLIYSKRGQTAKVIGVTSALPKEGKSTTSINMARVLAMSGSKVMLIDADLRRRSITSMLASDVKIGLIEVLNGASTIENALIHDQSGMHVLPLAPNSHRGVQPFDTPAFDKLMAHARATYDVIILDTAPVLAVVDTRLLLGHVDALALLARWRTTPIKAIRAAIHQIESVGGEIAGVALTLVNLKTQSKAGYGDASYYYAEMKDYYTTS
jgi:succinoglycan biosynthesis transport protein ExoP